MIKNYNLIIFFFILINLFNIGQAKENFFKEAKIKFDNKKMEDSKFLFQRNIVFNPKDSNSYLYLAKIYEAEANEKEEEKNINSTLLLDPSNENAMYMLIDMKLKQSDYKKVEDLTEKFQIICSLLCNKIESIKERLTNIEAKDES